MEIANKEQTDSRGANASPPYYSIASQIVQAREALGLSQEALAQRTGIQRSNISRLESGNYNPSVELLLRVARGLNMELQLFFTRQTR